jgi:hypothetical protein
VETWTYQNINSVFHNPDTLELSHEEKMELAKKQKIIKHDNTRLTKLPWKTDKQVRPSWENYLAFWRPDYSVVDPGFLPIPDPGSRIPDPGSRIQKQQ